MKRLLQIAFLLLVSSSAWAQSTANNTSACSANGVPTAGCNGVGSMPLSTYSGNTGAQTVVVDPLPVNVSTVSVQTQFTTVGNPRVIGEVQPWFCNTSTPCNTHQNIGMEMSNSAQALEQLQNMYSRGFQVAAYDWYGCSTYCPTPQSSTQAYNNQVTLAGSAAIAANPTTTPTFMIMLDQGAINGTGTGQCPYSSGSQSCILSALEIQMDYICATWCGQSYYEKNAKNGHAPVMLFITKSNWTTGGINWSTIYSSLAAHAISGQPCTGCSGGVYPVTVDLVDENAGAFGESGIMGGFAWPQPQTYSITNQFCWNSNNCSFDYLGNFYSTAQTQTTSVPNTITVGTIFKGFDDNNAISWGTNRVLAQQCGQVLNLTAGKIVSAGYSSGTPLQYVMFATWNDYEEGTEVETGVFNCLPLNRPTISGGNINWTLAPTDSTYASTTTISKQQIWTGTTAPTTLFADNIAPTATSHVAPALTTGQSAWVYTVGQPLIQNQLSPGAGSGTCPTGSAYFNVATQSYGTLAAMGVTTCFFVDPVSGSDSNDGLSEVTGHPFQHVPQMNNCAANCASAAVGAGVGIIIEGGETLASTYANIATGGSSGAPLYIGADLTWFSGSDWTPPTLAIAGTLPNQNANGESRIWNMEASWVTIDWLAVTGMTCASTVSGNYLWNNNQYDGLAVLHHYFSSFEAPSSLCPTSTKLPDGQNPAVWLFTQVSGNTANCHNAFEFNEVDGNGGTPTGTGGYQTVVTDPAGCFLQFSYNNIHDVCSGFGGYAYSVIGNSIANFGGAIGQFDCSSSAGLHNHGIRVQGDFATTVIAGNTLTNVGAEVISVNPNAGAPGTMIYNNVIWNNQNTSIPAGFSGVEICDNGAGHCTSGVASMFNNTIQQSLIGGYPLQVENSLATLYTANNHLINPTATQSGSYHFNSGAAAATWNCASSACPGDLYQTLAQANTAGYSSSQTYVYSPTSTSSPTVGIGTNESALFSTPLFETPYGSSEQTVSNVVRAVYPGISYINPRKPTPDAGAYEFAATNAYALNADNLYCPSSGIPSWPGAITSDGPASLPTACMDTALANTPATGSTVNVSTASELQSALTAATCGQKITLATGTYTGPFTLPALSCPTSNWVWVQSADMASLPGEQIRVSPCYAGVTSLEGRARFACPATPGDYMPQIITPNGSAPLIATAGLSSWRFMGLEITRTAGTGYVAQLTQFGDVGNVSNVIIDRSWLHGNDTGDETETGVDCSATVGCAVIDSYLSSFYCKSPGTCTDSHAILDGLNNVNSTQDGTHKFVNDYIESAGENILYGGGAANTTPMNSEIRLNTMFKPVWWNRGDPSYVGWAAPPLVKNLFELKNAQLLLGEGNTYQNNWGGFSQSGEAWKLIAVNQSGNCPTCFDANITMRYSTVNTAGQFLYGIGMIDTAGYYPAAENSFSVNNIVADNLNYPTCNGCENNASQIGIWQQPTIATTPQVLHGILANKITLVNSINAAQVYGILGLSGPPLPSPYAPYGITVENIIGLLQNNNGTGNVVGGTPTTNCADVVGGSPMFSSCGYPTVMNNCLINFGSATWPAGNITSIANQAGAYTSWNNGNFGNYVLSSNPCKGAATDGSDVGANIAVLSSVLAGNPAPAPPSSTYNLSLTINTGGSVSSIPSGISCSPTCVASFNSGTSVTLTPAASSGYSFSAWGGACSGSGGCSVTMNSNQSVTATFTPNASVGSFRLGTGTGSDSFTIHY